MRLGFAAFEFVNHATRKRYYPSTRPVASTNGRPIQFFTHRPQPQIDMADPLGWFIPRCREMGFDAIEGNLQPYLEPKETDRIGNLLAKHGIALSTDYGDDFSAPKKDPNEFRPFARVAKQLGVSAIGVGGMPFSINRFVDDPSFERQMEMIRTCLTPLVAIAEAEDLKLAFENHADYRCTDLIEHVVNPIGSPALGIKLDTGNAPLVIEDAVDAARASARVCYATHFKEMFISPVTPDGGKIVGAPLGRGHCRLDEVARILHEQAPDPENLILSVEIGWMPPNEDYFEWLEESVAWCRRELADYLTPLDQTDALQSATTTVRAD
ncbi:MAG TPA: sugar phosphate isomerase/epimerase family protein [Thermomicrobiales bacterium]|jgi:sugar phosphate isomerase/epimerase